VVRHTFDLLEVLGNETRRKILELLAREPKYLLQLSRELNVSQQAILKHINVLMRAGLIRAYEVKMGSLGPSRKYYELVKPISLSINLFKGYSEIEVHDVTNEVPDHLRGVLELLEKEELYGVLSEVRSAIQTINKELQEIRARERALLSTKCKLLSLVQEALERLRIPSSERRRILESLLG
jgi:ArsR family transcriptional regulator